MTMSRLPGSTVSPARRVLAALGLTAALLHGCNDGGPSPVDTCNDGETFRDLHLVNGLETFDGKGAVRIGWSPGPGRAQELPQDYFADVLPLEGVDTVMLTDQNELTVVLSDIEVPPPSSTVTFRMYFPDRRGYIDCTHSGSSDDYFLSVDLHFDAESALTHAAFTEVWNPGPY